MSKLASQFANGFAGRLLIALTAIQLVVSPIALVGVYRLIETELHDRFVDYARRDSAQYSRTLESNPNQAAMMALLEDLVLSGAMCSATLLTADAKTLGPPSTCVAQSFVEDFQYGGQGDQTYWVQLRAGAAGDLRLGFDEAPVDARLAQIARSLFYVGAALIAVVLALAAFVSLRLTRSLRQLSQAARSVAEGGVSESVLLQTPISEVASLSRDMESMRVSLVERAEALRDTNMQLVRARDEAHVAAYYDPLTRLPNRALFGVRAEALIAQAKRLRTGLAFLFIDLDRFKNVNDSLGHDIGDELLQALGKRLASALRESDLIARLGGDEFAIVVPNINSSEDARQIATKLLTLIEQPVLLHDRELQISASIGISSYPEDGQELHMLVKQADMAMYQAKGAGRNNVRVFSASMAHDADARMRTESELRLALRNSEFVLHYQPQYREGDPPELIGAEALIRWNHPTRGLLSPAHFIAVAEDMDLIVPLGQWVLQETCRQIADWRGQGCPISRVAVNVSVTQLKEEAFGRQLRVLLDKYKLSPYAIEIEVTESVMMEPHPNIIANLTVLKALGMHIALDDFGTGFSGLASLSRMPVHKIKIDQSFVQDMSGDATGAAIVRTTIALAKNLALEIIAEGVETEEQRDMLIELGCHNMQGYLYSRPIPPAELAALVSEQQSARTIYAGLIEI
jgi:diguanylate cyclase (GGDEF)-like protein